MRIRHQDRRQPQRGKLAKRCRARARNDEIGGGQRVLTWRYWTKPFGSDGYWVYRMFTVKPDGTILSWRWKGLQQP